MQYTVSFRHSAKTSGTRQNAGVLLTGPVCRPAIPHPDCRVTSLLALYLILEQEEKKTFRKGVGAPTSLSTPYANLSSNGNNLRAPSSFML